MLWEILPQVRFVVRPGARWSVLQQLWRDLATGKTEWRDVPTVPIECAASDGKDGAE